ncbi:hypothetical protein [Hyphomicrobium sp. CS1BSMeth3]|uniref:hypothetical protein n=1 Tax=Hyphomicrobium sp. CS1BSMeth3 TaxID=1892844 RepID=UPI0009317EEC|nr:hypothetical protein [Hyphomicrobium sp. CS1BSMeth3]
MKTRETRIANTYEPIAIYYSDADYVEYIRKDVPCVQRRVDEYLTLSLELYSRELVGFRIKGFRNLYIQHLRETQRVLDHEQFLRLVRVIEKTVELVGHSVFEEDKVRAEAYRAAHTLAQEDDAALPEMDEIAA